MSSGGGSRDSFSEFPRQSVEADFSVEVTSDPGTPVAEAILCGRNRDQQHWMEQGCFREMRIGQTTMLRLSGLREVLRWEVVGRPSAFYLHKPVWRGSDA